MSENPEEKIKYCLYCKRIIAEDKAYVTIRDFGEEFCYHKDCYDLLFPRDTDELNFER